MFPYPTRKVVVHGHRGCRGDRPENTIAGFLHALQQKSDALEMDVHLTSDYKLVVNHDPVISPDQFERVDGSPMPSNEEIRIFRTHSSELNNYRRKPATGSSWVPRHEDDTHLPLLSEVVQAVSKYCSQPKRSLPVFNIEVKSNPVWDNVYQPPPADIARCVRGEMRQNGIELNTVIQSFDPRILTELHYADRDLSLVFLAEKPVSVSQVIAWLGFAPWGLSLHHSLLNRHLVECCREEEIEPLAWTVNNVEEFRRLKELGVYHIITDFPGLIKETSRKLKSTIDSDKV